MKKDELPCGFMQSALYCKCLSTRHVEALDEMPPQCRTCGWNPREAERRKEIIRILQKSGCRPLKLIIRREVKHGTDNI